MRQNGNFGGGAGTGSGFRGRTGLKVPLGTRETRRKFSTSEKKSERVLKRHGKAVEPFVADGVEVPKAGELEKNAGNGAKETVGEGGGQEGEKENTSEDMAKEPSSSAPLSEEAQAAAKIPGDEGSRTGSVSAPASTSASSSGSEQSAAGKQETQAQSAAATSTTPNPLETVLHMPPPETEEEENASKPPHLQTPPYVHHFDTYTLVQQVGAGGFTNEQAITSMKAVRGLLALNLEVEKKGLVSKSDVENVSWKLCSSPVDTERWKIVDTPCRDTIANMPSHRKHISSAPPAPNSRPRSKIHARRMKRLCAGRGHYYNMKWIS